MNSNIFSRINQSLLAKYPTVWNTRIVWMLLLALIIHIGFFIAGYFYFSNPESLQVSRNDNHIIFSNGALLFSVAISLILLVLWMVNMFKNNAFKNFYPFSRGKVFLSFWYYLLIIFSCSTFYVSYVIGYKTFINKEYPMSTLIAEREVAMKAAPFLIQDFELYELIDRRAPAPLDTLERSSYYTKEETYDGPAIFNNGEWVQFYTTKVIDISTKDSQTVNHLDSICISRLYSELGDSVQFTLVDNVVDVASIVDTGYTIYNYSNNLYDYSLSSDGDNFIEMPPMTTIEIANNNYYDDDNDRNNKVINSTYLLLKEQNKSGIQKVLQDFLDLSKKYKIKHNINTAEWLNLVYKPQNQYRIDSFIRKVSEVDENFRDSYESNYEGAVATTTEDATASSAEEERYDRDLNWFKKYRTKYFIETSELHTLFENVVGLKVWSKLWDFFYIGLWFSVGLSLLLFVFRTTSLRAVIFSAVSSGLLAIVIGLFALFTNLNGDNEFVIAYFVMILYVFILVISLNQSRSISKLLLAISTNISVVFFMPILLLLLGTINQHQRKALIAKYGYEDFINHAKHPTILEQLGTHYLQWILLGAGILFIFFFSKIIRKWKALPEG